MMEHGFLALKSGEWEEYKNTFRAQVKATGVTIGGVRNVETNMTGNKQAKVVTGPMSSKAHAVRHGLCGNLINVLKLLANQQ